MSFEYFLWLKDLLWFRYRSLNVVYVVYVACCDSCLVYYALSLAFFLEWACVPTVATVCVFALWLVIPNYACIVSSNDGLHIVHATIADLSCVSVKNFVKFVMRRKCLSIMQAEKIASYVAFDTVTERRVKPNVIDVALPISARLLWCFFHVA